MLLIAMAVRYGFSQTDPDVLTHRFQVGENLAHVAMLPSYNVQSGQIMPVVTRRNVNRLEMMQWGLQPGWLRTERPLINAYADTLMEKKTFRDLLPGQRCLIPASWFYAWQTMADGKKPYYIGLTETKLFAFAGLYDVEYDRNGHAVRRFLILTCAPNALVAPITDRMPAILTRQAEDAWLNPAHTAPEQLLPLLCPYPAEQMYAYRIGKLINIPNVDTEDIIKPEGNSR